MIIDQSLECQINVIYNELLFFFAFFLFLVNIAEL